MGKKRSRSLGRKGVMRQNWQNGKRPEQLIKPGHEERPTEAPVHDFRVCSSGRSHLNASVCAVFYFGGIFLHSTSQELDDGLLRVVNWFNVLKKKATIPVVLCPARTFFEAVCSFSIGTFSSIHSINIITLIFPLRVSSSWRDLPPITAVN